MREDDFRQHFELEAYTLRLFSAEFRETKRFLQVYQRSDLHRQNNCPSKIANVSSSSKDMVQLTVTKKQLQTI
jgi:hypothetical protein